MSDSPSDPRETAASPTDADSDMGQEFGGEVAQYVTFCVGDRNFGIDIMSIGEIRQWTPVTLLPHQPEWNRGVLNLRGAIVPVHDLRVRLGGELTDPTLNHVVVIALIGGKTIGILVDGVSDILSVRAEQVRALPPNVMEVDEAAISGLVRTGNDMVALLNLEHLFPIAA